MRSSSTRFCVAWQRVPLYSFLGFNASLDPTFSFTVCLFKAGGVRWLYGDDVSPNRVATWFVRTSLGSIEFHVFTLWFGGFPRHQLVWH